MICLDSSVIIALLRKRRSVETIFLERIEQDNVPYVIPLICAQEVMQGARDKKDWNLLRSYFETQVLVPAEQTETYFNAASIFFDLRRRGITVRSSIDCLIAQICLDSDFSLLHLDSDFKKIKAVRPLRFAL